MATLDVQTIDIHGLDFDTDDASSGGDEFENNGRTFFYVNNVSGGELDVTFAGQGETNFGTEPDKVVAVPNVKEFMIGPFLKAWFNDGDGMVQVTYESHTSMTVAAVHVPDAVAAAQADA